MVGLIHIHERLLGLTKRLKVFLVPRNGSATTPTKLVGGYALSHPPCKIKVVALLVVVVLVHCPFCRYAILVPLTMDEAVLIGPWKDDQTSAYELDWTSQESLRTSL